MKEIIEKLTKIESAIGIDHIYMCFGENSLSSDKYFRDFAKKGILLFYADLDSKNKNIFCEFLKGHLDVESSTKGMSKSKAKGFKEKYEQLINFIEDLSIDNLKSWDSPEVKFYYDLKTFNVGIVNKLTNQSGHSISRAVCYRDMIEYADKQGEKIECNNKYRGWELISNPDFNSWNNDVDHPENVYRIAPKKVIFRNTIGEEFYNKMDVVYWFLKDSYVLGSMLFQLMTKESYEESKNCSQIYKTEESRDKALEEYKKSIKPKYRAFKSEEAEEYLGLKIRHKEEKRFGMITHSGDGNLLNDYFKDYIKLDGSPVGVKIN